MRSVLSLFTLLPLIGTTAWGQATPGRVAYVNQSGLDKVPIYTIVAASPGHPASSIPIPKGTAGPYTVELWYGTDVNSLAPASGSQIRDWAGPGVFKGNANFDIVGTKGGEKVWLELRVWENLGGTITSWAAAEHAGVPIRLGESAAFSLTLGGVDDAAKLYQPVTMLSELKTFGLHYVNVPEPTLWSLPLLALITAKAWRRNAKGTFLNR
ncbi:MAG TPA: hypothetical protein DCM86_18400 [Verrucomicrobiales bacterium]|nr:hypothetical protein [Verrucomicrobiales bacterium]